MPADILCKFFEVQINFLVKHNLHFLNNVCPRLRNQTETLLNHPTKKGNSFHAFALPNRGRHKKVFILWITSAVP